MNSARRSKTTKARKGNKRSANVKVSLAKVHWECVICGKMCGGNLPQGRNIEWAGSRSHACNACGISWRDLERKKRVHEKRAPTDIEWANWKATRPNFRQPISDEEAAWILVELALSGKSIASSSSNSSSIASDSLTLSSSPSLPDWSYSLCSASLIYPKSSVPSKNRPDSLRVEVEVTVDEDEALSDPGLTDSTGSLYSPREPDTPLLISSFASEVLFAAPPKILVEGHSAYQKW